MARRCARFGVILMLLGLLVSACGGEDAGAVSTSPSTTQATTTTQGTTVTAATTSEATTSTNPDLHPILGLSWADVWPPDGGTASYRVGWGQWGLGNSRYVARIDYGIDWQGRTWDRISIMSERMAAGDYQVYSPGYSALMLYFDRPTPWAIRLWAAERLEPIDPNAPRQLASAVDRLNDAPEIDLLSFPDQPLADLESRQQYVDWLLDGTGNAYQESQVEYTPEFIGIETVDVPAGRIEGCYHLRYRLGGALYEGTAPTRYSDIWVHPDHFLVKWENGPFHWYLELLSAWTGAETAPTTTTPSPADLEYQADVARIQTLWDDFSASWMDMEGAAAFIAEHNYPAWDWPAEVCRALYEGSGWLMGDYIQAVVRPETIQRDDAWVIGTGYPAEGQVPDGRVYSMTLDMTTFVSGTVQTLQPVVHVTVIGEDAYFFWPCA